MISDVADALNQPPPNYGTGDDFHARFARSLVAAADLRPGESVLDVATGTGPAAIAAAEAIGSAGRVVGVDIAAGMLRRARQLAASRHGATVSLLRGDGARLPFADARFDVVLCSSSLAWFLDIPVALREWARVTKPGGRLAFSGLAASALPLGALLRRHLAGYGVKFPDLNEPLDTPEKCRALIRDAGFALASVHLDRYDGALASAEEAWSALGDRLVPDPHGVQAWDTLRRHPPSLWARVRRGEPIPIPLDVEHLDQLKREYLAEVDVLSSEAGIPNPLTTLLVVARRTTDFE